MSHEALIHLSLMVASVTVPGITCIVICLHSGSQIQLQALLSMTPPLPTLSPGSVLQPYSRLTQDPWGYTDTGI